MKRAILVALVCCSSFVHISQSFAKDVVWYDSHRKALAVDPYADGYGGSINVDFNSDHLAAGIIDQSLWHHLYGSVTKSGLYETTLYPWGSFTLFGWGERLGDLVPKLHFSSYVTSLYDGSPAVDGYHYSAPEWNVPGRTVIYVQPAEGNAPIHLEPEDLENTFVRINHGEWTAFHDLDSPGSGNDSRKSTVTISPRTLNSKSSGEWVTAQVELPEPYLASDLDIGTVYIAIKSDVQVNGSVVESVKVTSKVALTGEGSNKVIAKFSRQQLMDLLSLGESVVSVQGEMYDGAKIVGETILRIVH